MKSIKVLLWPVIIFAALHFTMLSDAQKTLPETLCLTEGSGPTTRLFKMNKSTGDWQFIDCGDHSKDRSANVLLYYDAANHNLTGVRVREDNGHVLAFKMYTDLNQAKVFYKQESTETEAFWDMTNPPSDCECP